MGAKTCSNNNISTIVVASTRRITSDTGAFADWVPSSSSIDRVGDLSLGFNARTTQGGGGGGAGGSSTSNRSPTNYGLIPSEISMVGLRSGDLHIVASPSPPPSFHHHHHQDGASLIHSHQQDHHHHHHHHSSISINNSSNSSSSTALGVCGSVIPTGHVGEDHSHNINRNQTSSRSEIQLWQNQQSLLQNPNILFNAAAGGVNIIKSRRSTTSVISTTASTITCHDCGNQAKKDCSHRRCRTCCKSRGFDCATHVKSTWVPAARRRERHQLLAASSSVAVAGGSSSSTTSAGVKKPRLISSQATNSHTSTSSSARSFGTSSSHHQDASFREALPRQVLAPAVFKCVRVSAIDDGGDQDEYAYQAVVKIGGHVFKGFLYDQGVIDDERSSDGLFTDMSDLHLGGINSNNSTRSGDGISKQGILMTSSSSPIIDPSITTTTVYVKSGSGGLLGVGTDYNNQHF